MKKFGLMLAGAVLAMVGVMTPVVMGSAWATDDEKSKLCEDLKGVDDQAYAAAGCGTQKDAGVVVNAVIEVVLGFTGVIAVGVVIYGGFLFLSSSGDASKVKRGQDAIKYGLIGLVVSLLAYGIVALVSSMVANG